MSSERSAAFNPDYSGLTAAQATLPALRVEHLSKCYRVYNRPEDRLKEYILPRLPGIRSWSRKWYSKEVWALRDISFEVQRGQTVGIVGRNGSGKSTLLQLICGTLAATSGTVEAHGRVGALLELGAGFNPEFTGIENVCLGASIYGLSRSEIDSRIDDIAAFADIGDFIERPVKTYSSGMYVRLAFAMLAHIDAEILIIDEALAVGDAYFVQKCMRFLRAYIERGTLLFVSHDLGAIANLCDSAILLKEGRIETRGVPKRVLERYLEGLCEEPESPDSASAAPPVKRTGGHGGHGSAFRSQVQPFGFHAASGGFGTGEARIVSVGLLGFEAEGKWIAAGTPVNLRIVATSLRVIDRPIIGFQLKDRLGQVVFGENTYLRYEHEAPSVQAGGELEANFEFDLPFLPTGDYSFSVAIAEGSQDAHVQLHWLHDALMIRSQADSEIFGLVGVPMKHISLASRAGVSRSIETAGAASG